MRSRPSAGSRSLASGTVTWYRARRPGRARRARGCTRTDRRPRPGRTTTRPRRPSRAPSIRPAALGEPHVAQPAPEQPAGRRARAARPGRPAGGRPWRHRSPRRHRRSGPRSASPAAAGTRSARICARHAAMKAGVRRAEAKLDPAALAVRPRRSPHPRSSPALGRSGRGRSRPGRSSRGSTVRGRRRRGRHPETTAPAFEDEPNRCPGGERRRGHGIPPGVLGRGTA